MASSIGASSVFPVNIDDFGGLLVNNTCQIVEASLFNKLSDALFNVEVKTRRSFLTGKSGVLTPTVSGAARPNLIVKALTINYAGGPATIAAFTFGGPIFTTQELVMNPTPFASGNLIHCQIRKVPGDAYAQKSYHCGLIRPSDLTGNSGFSVRASTLRHGNSDYTIGNGTYVISLLITAH